jgi:peptide/nickel transport system substrate-binding protein
MWSKGVSIRVLIATVASMAMLGVLACGGVDEPAAPAAAPAPVVDTAAIAAEVAKSVAASAPKTASPAEIQSMVEAAVAASAVPGVSAADMEAAVAKATGGQLSAPEIKSIVDASVRALPAPELDVTALTAMVEKSVKASVPKGTSAAEISRMVQAAVVAATADVATRGDMEAAVTKSVSDAAASQLSAAEVKSIVEASLKATESAVMEATMAAKQAGMLAGEARTLATLSAQRLGPLPITDAARTDPKLLAKRSPGGLHSFRSDIVPTKFNEAPMLAALVKAGKLPPVEERVSDEPLVLAPTEAIGVYGGTWRRGMTFAGDDSAAVVYSDRLWKLDGDGATRLNDVAKRFDVTNGGRVVTIAYRKGMKWSDGEPVTSAGMQFMWDGITNNLDYLPNGPGADLNSPITGNLVKFEVLDDVTFRLTWDDPYYHIIEKPHGGLRGGTWGGRNGGYLTSMMSPDHYLKQFHPDYTDDKAKLDKMIKDGGFDGWVKHFISKLSTFTNLEKPMLTAWVPVVEQSGSEWILERNFYYHSVDPAGNQLPYIDRIHVRKHESTDSIAFAAISGEIDMQLRHFSMEKVPLYKQNEVRGNYTTYIGKGLGIADGAIHINQAYDKDPLIGKLLRTRDFRRALSLGIDRKEINEVFFLGQGDIRAFSPTAGTPFWPGKDYHTRWATHDVLQANELLDGITDPDISERDADGFRVRPDDGKRFTLHWEASPSGVGFITMLELVKQHWADLGIAVTTKVDKEAYTRVTNNDLYLIANNHPGYSLDPWQSTVTVPAGHYAIYCRCAVDVGRWWETGGRIVDGKVTTPGEAGVSPLDPKYMNPEGEFPFAKIMDLYNQGFVLAQDNPARIALGKQIHQIVIDEVLHIGTVGGTGLGGGVGIVKNNFRNWEGDKTARSLNPGGGFGLQPTLYFFDEGKNDAGY